MMDAFPIPPERLLEESQWLRTLARHLAGPDEGDDLAQAAWLKALEQPPGRIRGLRPWLTTVVRHALERARGSDAARRRRELAASRAEAVASHAELEARASLHRAVAEAVLSLDEPGRSTVLLRYFDDRKPSEIARIHGVPVETVRSRLRRALAVLRTRLDEEFESRERWAVGAAGGFVHASAETTTAAGSLIAGVLLMSTKAKVLVALGVFVLIVAGIGLTWRPWAQPETKAPSDPAAGDEVAEAPAPPSLPTPTPPPPDVTATSQTTTTPIVAASAVRVTVHVTDDQGNGVAGAAVAADSDPACSATTDAGGDAILEIPKPSVATIRTQAPGFAESTISSAAMTDGARFQVDLVPLTTLRVHVQDEAGAAIGGATVEMASEDFMVFVPADYRREVRTTDDEGNAVFPAMPSIRWHARAHRSGFADGFAIPGYDANGPTASISDTTIVLKRGADLLIRFVEAATEAPVPGVQAAVSPDKRRAFDQVVVWSDQSGAIAIGRPLDATTKVSIFGTQTAEPGDLQVPPGQGEATVRMSEPRPILCRVTREDHTPVDEAVLEYDSPRVLLPMKAEAGGFVVQGQCLNRSPQFRFLVANGATSWHRITSWKAEITLVAHASLKVRGQIVDADGRPVAGALITIEGRPYVTARLGAGQGRPKDVTTSDEAGFFAGDLGADPVYLIEVATALGPCARHFVAAARFRDTTPSGVAGPAIRLTRAAPDGTCDVGRMVVPTRTGDLRVTVQKLLPDGSEVLVTPIDANADRLPERRARVKANSRAEIFGLPEGDYDVSVGPRGHVLIFGARGTRVHVTAGAVTEVRRGTEPRRHQGAR